jgi:hypothetical protein
MQKTEHNVTDHKVLVLDICGFSKCSNVTLVLSYRFAQRFEDMFHSHFVIGRIVLKCVKT